MSTKTFKYEAIDSTGGLVKGKIESDSPAGAASSLAGQRLTPLQVTGLGTGLKTDLKVPGLGGRTTLKDLAVFARQFASMTSSGLTLLRTPGWRGSPWRRAPRSAASSRRTTTSTPSSATW